MKKRIETLETRESARLVIAATNAAETLAAAPAAIARGITDPAARIAAIRGVPVAWEDPPPIARYLVNNKVDQIMPIKTTQSHWPKALWTYLLAGHEGELPPHVSRDKDFNVKPNYYPLDYPRRYRHVPQEMQGPSSRMYEVTFDIDALLQKEGYDPDLRSLDLNKVRASFIRCAADAEFPPQGLLDVEDGRRRFTARLQGLDDGSDCLLCYGPHYLRWCPVFPLASDRRCLLAARGACLICRKVHPVGGCTGGELCADANCKRSGDRHRQEFCSEDALDLARQALHGRR